MPVKVVSMTVEDEVTFLQDVDVEFVSLVRHAANRTPFKILKEDKGGKRIMDKVMAAILIPNDLDDESVARFLEGYRSDEVVEFDTYKAYTQVDEEAIDPESVEVIVLDQESKVYAKIAALKEAGEPDEKKKGEDETEGPKVVEKEALDYATMDVLYDQLYAMADIVSGSMRQDNVDVKTRRKTILTAIDNFRSSAEMLLKSLNDELVLPAVKAEDHPKLPPLALKEEKEEVVEPAFDPAAFEQKLKDEIQQALSGTVKPEDVEEKVTESIDSVKDALNKIAEQVTTAVTEIEALKPLQVAVDALKELPEKVEGLLAEVDKLKAVPTAQKTEIDDDPEDPAAKAEKGSFKGTLFSVGTKA